MIFYNMFVEDYPVLTTFLLNQKVYENADELKEGLGENISAGYDITDEVLEEVNTWLSKFGINGKEAKVTIDPTTNKVIITYIGSETLTVQGLK